MLQEAKDGVAIVTEVIKAAGANPDAKAAAENLAKSALTITKTINHALLPLAAVNFAFDKAKTYFAEKFEQDLSSKASQIPHDKVVEPKASIAGPVLQGLAFSHEEPNLKEMYLNLLNTAMDGRVENNAHPAFAHIIGQLNSAEAGLLKILLYISDIIAIVEVRANSIDGNGWVTLEKHLLNLTNKITGMPIITPNLSAMVDNWVRLGLVEVDYMSHAQGNEAYQWVENHSEYLKFKSQIDSFKFNLGFQKGLMRRTSLGIQFGKAAGLIE